MRIAFDARFVTDHYPGIGRYASGLAGALAALEGSHELLLITAPGQRSSRHDLASLRAAARVISAEAPPPLAPHAALALRRLLRRHDADVYHTPYLLFPSIGLPCPAVVTLHDAIPRLLPAESSPRARLSFDLLVRLALRAARRVIAVSRQTRADLHRCYRAPLDRIDVVYEAAGPEFCPPPQPAVAALRARYALPPAYGLCVSSAKPHKNLGGLLRAWALLAAPPPLVLAGAGDPRLAEQAARLLPPGALRLLPEFPEADLPTLYGGATVFVFPSRYEGFGLPPLEAMACGAPVVCSRAASLPEVTGGAALLVDPDDPPMIARAVELLLTSPQRRRALAEAGLRRAAEFSWRRTALETLAVYRRARREHEAPGATR